MLSIRVPYISLLSVIAAFSIVLFPVANVSASPEHSSSRPNYHANARAHEQMEVNETRKAENQENPEVNSTQNSSSNNLGSTQDTGISQNASAVQANLTTEHDHKITICHATASDTNPFVQITVAKAAAYHAHINHQDEEDIVPPFTYDGHAYSRNWNATNQAIFNNDCVNPDDDGDILGETIVNTGSRGAGNIPQSTDIASAKLANTGFAISWALLMAASLIVSTLALSRNLSAKPKV